MPAVATNGVTTVFTFDFKVFADNDISVTWESSAGAQVVLVLNTDYTVVRNPNQNTSPGGTITTTTALSAGNLAIFGGSEYKQETDIPNAGPFFGDSIESALDYLAILSQQLKELINRSFKVSPVDATLADLPSATLRANKYLYFDALGNPTSAAVVVTGGTPASPFGQSIVLTASAAAATNLILSGSALRFDGTNLGIGVVPSAWGVNYKALQVGTNGSSFVGFVGNSQTFMVSNAFNDGAWKYITSSGAGYYAIQGVSNGVHAWFTAPSGTAGNPVTFTQVMTLDAAGNLGLGVTPSAWFSGREALQLSSGASVNGAAASSSFVEIGANFYHSTTPADTYIASSTASKYRQSSGAHQWFTAPSGTAGNPVTFTQQMGITATGDLQFNSGYGSAATAYGCRAWVNFNGTLTTPIAPRGSGNVSSVTKAATGDYTINFTTAMPDANYAVSIATGQTASATGADIGNTASTAPTTGALRIGTRNSSNGAALDCTYISVAIFR
jgi:hypothetical protein